jgi:hypothetical protein
METQVYIVGPLKLQNELSVSFLAGKGNRNFPYENEFLPLWTRQIKVGIDPATIHGENQKNLKMENRNQSFA